MQHKEGLTALWEQLTGVLSTGAAGALGAFTNQLNGQKKSFTLRVVEWFCGGVCAVYGSELLAYILHHLLLKYDLIGQGQILPQNLMSLSGFLCGMLGLSAWQTLINTLKEASKGIITGDESHKKIR